MRASFGVSMISVSTPPMSFGWTKKIERAVRADARLAEHLRALAPPSQALAAWMSGTSKQR